MRSRLSCATTHPGRAAASAGWPKRVLAARLLPAAVALAEAADTVLTGQSPACQVVGVNFTVSPACLIGRCRARLDGPGCDTAACEHDCHSQVRQDAWQAGAPAA